MIDWIKRNQGPLTRMLLNAAGAALIALGWADERILPFLHAPEVQQIVGSLLVSASVGGWQMAQRKGWTT